MTSAILLLLAMGILAGLVMRRRLRAKISNGSTQASSQILVLVLPAELSDGCSRWCVPVDDISSAGIGDALATWAGEAVPGDLVTIELRLMPVQLFQELPEA